MTLAVEAWNLNRWTVREGPGVHLLNVDSGPALG